MTGLKENLAPSGQDIAIPCSEWSVQDDSSQDDSTESTSDTDVVSQDVGSQDVVSQNVASQDVVSQDVVSQDVVSQDFVSQEDVVSQDVISQEDVVSQKDVVVSEQSQQPSSQTPGMDTISQQDVFASDESRQQFSQIPGTGDITPRTLSFPPNSPDSLVSLGAEIADGDIELQSLPRPATGTSSTAQLIPPSASSGSHLSLDSQTSQVHEPSTDFGTRPAGSCRQDTPPVPNYKPIPLRWFFLLFLLIFIVGLFAFLEYEVQTLPPMHYSLLPGDPTFLKNGSGVVKQVAAPDPLPEPDPRPPESAYPEPIVPVNTYCGWGPPRWYVDVEWVDETESIINLAERLETFTIDDASWCPCNLSWPIPWEPSKEYAHPWDLLGGGGVWETTDDGCKSVMLAIQSFNEYKLTTWGQNWYKLNPHLRLTMSTDFYTFTTGPLSELETRPNWEYASTDGSGNFIIPLVSRTADTLLSDVFGNRVEPTDSAYFPDHYTRPGWGLEDGSYQINPCWYMQNPHALNPLVCNEPPEPSILSTSWWVLSLSKPGSSSAMSRAPAVTTTESSVGSSSWTATTVPQPTGVAWQPSPTKMTVPSTRTQTSRTASHQESVLSPVSTAKIALAPSSDPESPISHGKSESTVSSPVSNLKAFTSVSSAKPPAPPQATDMDLTSKQTVPSDTISGSSPGPIPIFIALTTSSPSGNIPLTNPSGAKPNPSGIQSSINLANDNTTGPFAQAAGGGTTQYSLSIDGTAGIRHSTHTVSISTAILTDRSTLAAPLSSPSHGSAQSHDTSPSHASRSRGSAVFLNTNHDIMPIAIITTRKDINGTYTPPPTGPLGGHPTTTPRWPPKPNGHGPIDPGAHAYYFNLDSEADYLMVSVVPVLLATLLLILLEVLTASLNSMLPFRALTRHPLGALPQDSLSLCRNPSFLVAPFIAARQLRQFRDALPLLSALLSGLATILVTLSSEVIRLEVTSDCSNRFNDGDMPPPTHVGFSPERVCAYGLRQSGPMMRVTEALLVVLGVLVICITYQLTRWRSGVAADPWSIASMTGFLRLDGELHRLLLQATSGDRQNAQSGDMHDVGRQAKKALQGRRFRLGFASSSHQASGPPHGGDATATTTSNSHYGIEVVPTATEDNTPTRVTVRDPPTRKAVKKKSAWWHISSATGIWELTIRITALLFTVGLLILILHYETVVGVDTGFERFMNSQTIGVRILFAAFGTTINAFWGYYFSCKFCPQAILYFLFFLFIFTFTIL